MATRSRRKQPTAEEVPEDAEMADAPAAAQDEVAAEEEGAEIAEDGGDDEEDEEEETQRLPGSTPTAASFEFLEENHTMGNALRFVIMKNPNVEFCAYAIPHPSEAKMNIRIQTYEGTAIEALEKGLRDLQDLCDVVGEKFWDARNQYMAATEA
ncbi:DNA-directed RNA polymerases I and III subunit RPAC2 [Sporothrix brasiliensis 5110]|uniref:DNA-directed RNA polymerases I and III subunit RPAC2 n=1 Tax=Sporothrix brasiliensis 5110 TaxID=1398154 RepID=A0A0C2ITQ6_9PEZI|nr:DNA-directed RNA polymerases I and III subunit RPAC2 [Sporothrix brasiliensis 5110]KIH90155.1 DNA-directed RNA polymerases I and III subunit RPAC2 [Sporothrix brasiliensis 5110]